MNKQFDTSEVGLTRRVSTDVHRVMALRMMRLASGGSVAGPMISEKASAFEESEGHHEAAKALALAVTGVMVRRLWLSFGGASMTGEQVVQLGGGMIGDAAPHASASQARGSAR